MDFILPAADPAVSALLDASQRRQKDARLPKIERSRVQKERRRQQARQPGRINLDLPIDLKKRLVALAGQESVPISQLVAFLLIEPLHAMESGERLLWGYKRPSKCPRYDSVLDLARRLGEKKSPG